MFLRSVGFKDNISDDKNESWFERELASCQFPDQRLHKRLSGMLEQISGSIGESIPHACQDWANTKAAYRFFSNDRFGEHEILQGHFDATRERFSQTSGHVLVLHDTTTFSFKRTQPEKIGATYRVNSGKDKKGRFQQHTVCGLFMHGSLAVTTNGLPLGLSAIKFFTRSKFKGTEQLKRKINPTRVPIETKESVRWLENMRQSTELLEAPERLVHIGDRESDIYELFCLAEELGTAFLVRSCVDRLAENRHRKISQTLQETAVRGRHQIDVHNRKGKLEKASLELKYRKIRVLPPIGKQRRYPALDLTILHARERGTPKTRTPIDWMLITNLPVTTRKAAIEKLEWYATRWKIETFHKILKSGCRAEDAKLRTAERLVKLVAVFCIVAWRVFWMTMINRTNPKAKPETALTEMETKLLDRLIADKNRTLKKKKTMSDYLVKIARLGGYLNRASDPPPGNMVMWRGMSRLNDIHIGMLIGAEIVGN